MESNLNQNSSMEEASPSSSNQEPAFIPSEGPKPIHLIYYN